MHWLIKVVIALILIFILLLVIYNTTFVIHATNVIKNAKNMVKSFIKANKEESKNGFVGLLPHLSLPGHFTLLDMKVENLLPTDKTASTISNDKTIRNVTKEGYTVSIPDNTVPDPIMQEIAEGGDSMNSISRVQSNETLPWANGMFEGYDSGVPYMNVMGYGDQFITWSGAKPSGAIVGSQPGKKCCPRWTKNSCTSSPYGACGCPVKISIEDPKSTAIAGSLADTRNV